jgi:hypothetical protein
MILFSLLPPVSLGCEMSGERHLLAPGHYFTIQYDYIYYIFIIVLIIIIIIFYYF